MPVTAGVAGKDTGRKLPFPPMWACDGQAPERQAHGPAVQGCQVLGRAGSIRTRLSTRYPYFRYRGYLPLLQADCLRTQVPPYRSCGPVEFHRISRDLHWKQNATDGDLPC